MKAPSGPQATTRSGLRADQRSSDANSSLLGRLGRTKLLAIGGVALLIVIAVVVIIAMNMGGGGDDPNEQPTSFETKFTPVSMPGAGGPDRSMT